MAMEANNYSTTVSVSTDADKLVADQANYQTAGDALTTGSNNVSSDSETLRALANATEGKWDGKDADAFRTEARAIADTLDAAAASAGTSGANANTSGDIMAEAQNKNTGLFNG